MSIQVQDVSKSFGSFQALRNVSLTIPSGCLLALLGPSGSGKTTLLRVIAGLECTDRGAILFFDDDVTGRPVRDRGVGFVFQHYALFRQMTVFDNIAFGLTVRKTPRREVNERVRELLALVRLEGLGGRYPSQLSGGQRQRVALARALAVRPRILLLDEPFGALDARVRQELRAWMRDLHQEMHVTTIFVTHDQEEAFEVADQVVVMNEGKIEQVGSPESVFEQPGTPFVMDFLGNVNVFHGRVENGNAQIGPFSMDYPTYPHPEPREGRAFVRPHELEIDRCRTSDAALPAKITQVKPAGAITRVRLVARDFGAPIAVELQRAHALSMSLKVGDDVFVRPRSVRLFTEEADYAI